MLAKVLSAGLWGLEAHLIDVEVDIGGGLPQFSIVGLPDATVRESRDRVRAALRNSGFEFRPQKITVNLAPASIKKEGAGLELAIAIGILVAEGMVSSAIAQQYVFVGELSLDGSIRPVAGALSIGLACRDTHAVILPHRNAREAAAIERCTAYGVHTLPEVIEFLHGRTQLLPAPSPHMPRPAASGSTDILDEDFADVKGQPHAKRALEVAAAGGHNVLMIGPPGAGKTMLARRLPGILAPMEHEECLEASRVHSVAGTLPTDQPLLTVRPFRAPHHHISEAGLIGGGSIPKPGEISMAHQGVLFLDEVLEFRRAVLDGLRQPLEQGSVTIARVNATLTYPARAMLVAAMNPCPCGYLGERTRTCLCSPHHIRRYRARLSGPLRDRLDIHVEMPALPVAEFSTHAAASESSAAIRHRVTTARTRQVSRYHHEDGILTNAQLKPRHLAVYCAIDPSAQKLLEGAIERLGLSARAYGRVLRVARTIADLDGLDTITASHVAEAVQYRALDRPLAL